MSMAAAGEASMKPFPMLLVLLVLALSCSGCSQITSGKRLPAAGTIIDRSTGLEISFGQLLEELLRVRVIYAGEKHTRACHHAIQLRLLKALADKDPDLMVGMEMFARPYQGVLDLWSAGKLTWEELLRKTHWYANWRFDAGLYRGLLEEIQRRRLKLVALNIAFHIPPKIAVGGIENLSPAEKARLPSSIDYGDARHRAYLKKIYEAHKLKGRDRFEDFYAAQCVWEEIMAQSIAENLGNGRMLVILGNGHIYRKFGVPRRAFRRTGAPYRTIYPAAGLKDLPQDVADFIWIAGGKQP